MRKFGIFAVVLGLCVATQVQAAPTIHGPTGLIEMPTAESLKYKEYNAGIDFNFQPNDQKSTHYKFNLGTFKGWELGVSGGTTPSEGVFVNVKYFLMQEEARYPIALALGAENLSSKEPSVYMVASKKFKENFDAHFGFRGVFASSVDASVMGGVEYFFNDTVSFLADIYGENQKYRVNVGAKAYLMENLSARLQVMDLTTSTYTGVVYGIGVSYSGFIE